MYFLMLLLQKGAIYNDNWFCIPFVGDSKWQCNITIGFKELFLVVKSVATFGHFFPSARVTLHIDNEAVCYCVNNAVSKNDDWMKLIRDLYYILIKFNWECHAIHLISEQNYVADAISRLDYVKFHAARPNAGR